MTFSLDDEDEDEVPSMEEIMTRLIALHMMDFAWLYGLDLSDGGPDTIREFQDFDWGTE